MMRSVLLVVCVMVVVATAHKGGGYSGASDKERRDEIAEGKREAKSFLSIVKDVEALEREIIAKESASTDKVEAKLTQQKEEVKAKATDCSKKENADKEACKKQVKKEEKRVDQQKQLVEDLKLCRDRYGDDDKKRKECVDKVGRVYLDLHPKSLGSKLVEQAKRDLEKAEKALVRGSAEAAALIKRVEKDLESRRNAIERRRKACGLLLDEDRRKECLRDLRKQARRTKAIERMVKRLGRCASVFADDTKKRERCTLLLGKRIEKALKVNLASRSRDDIDPHRPKTLEELEIVERRLKRRMGLLIKKLEAKREECNTKRCQVLVDRKIRTARRLRKLIHRKFRPRRVCLLKRRKYRQAEFARRAREHAALARKHKEGEQCSTRRCLARVGREERRLAGRISASRHRRRRAFSKLACAPIGKIRLSRAEFAAMRRQERLRGRYSRRARLSAKLARAYKKAARCVSTRCHRRWRDIIAKLEADYELLNSKERLSKGKRRHSRRVRLHRALARLYREASACGNSKCLKRVSRRLRRVKAALKKRKLNFLGLDKEEAAEARRAQRRKAKTVDASEEAEANEWVSSLDKIKPLIVQARERHTGDATVDSWLNSDSAAHVTKRLSKAEQMAQLEALFESASTKRRTTTTSATTTAATTTTTTSKPTPVPDAFDWYSAMNSAEKARAQAAATTAPLDPLASVGKVLLRPFQDIVAKPPTLSTTATTKKDDSATTTTTTSSTTTTKTTSTATTTTTVSPHDEYANQWVHSSQKTAAAAAGDSSDDSHADSDRDLPVVDAHDNLLSHLLAKEGRATRPRASTPTPKPAKEDKTNVHLADLSIEDLAGYGV